MRRPGAGVLKKLTAEGAREQFEFNRSMMTSRDDVDLGIAATPPSPGRLPVDPDAVARVVGYLGNAETTALALRLLSEP